MPHHFAGHTLAALPAALFLLTLPASAQVSYSNRPVFDAVNPGLTAFNFNGLAPLDGYTSPFPNNTLTRDGVSFSQANLLVISKGYYSNYALDNSDFLQAYGNTLTRLNVALPANVTAFGADFGTLDTPETVQVLVNGLALPVPFTASTSDAGSFFGYTSLTPISSLAFIERSGGALNVNDVEFGQANPVPEASSALSLSLLLGLGLGGAAWSARRKKATA